VDAVITSFGLQRAAVVESRFLLPVAMSSAWSYPGTSDKAMFEPLTTAAEIYQSASFAKLSVLQIRSPVVDGRSKALADEIYAWAKSAGVAELVLVAPNSSHVKTDADLAEATNLRYVQAGLATPVEDLGLGAQILPLSHGAVPEAEEETEEGAPPRPPLTAAELAVQERFIQRQFLHGCGITRPLLFLAADAAEGPDRLGSLCLLGFTAETTDFGLAEQLARCALFVVSGRVKAATPEFKPPPSWMFEAAALEAQQLFG